MARIREIVATFGAVGRNASLRRVLLAFFLFNAVEWATWVAMLVFAFERGGVGAAGAVMFIQLAPAVVVAPLGSSLGDRLPRNRALAIGYVAQAVALASTAAALAVEASVAVVYPLAALSACTITLTRPVHHAIVPELAATPGEVTAANAASSTLEGLSVFVGPLLAGVLLSAGGAWAVFAIAAAAQTIAALACVRLSRHDVPSRGVSSTSVVADAFEGMRALRRERGATAMTGLVGVQQVVVGMLDVLAVVLALRILHLGPAGPGLMTSASGIGVLLGALTAALLVGRRRMGPAIAIALVGIGVPLGLVALVDVPLTAIVLLAVSGAFRAIFDVAGRTLLQRSVDERALARVFGFQEGLMMAGLAVGAVVAPLSVAAAGPRGAFVVAGGLLPILGAAAWSRVRTLDARAAPPGPELGLLEGLAMFRPLEAPVLERLARHLVPVRAPRGAVVIREGDPGDRFYVIAEGAARVTAGGVALADLGPGDYFGEIALLRDVPRTATVSATTSLDLFALERDEFLAAVTGSRPGAEAADREADRRLRERHAG